MKIKVVTQSVKHLHHNEKSSCDRHGFQWKLKKVFFSHREPFPLGWVTDLLLHLLHLQIHCEQPTKIISHRHQHHHQCPLSPPPWSSVWSFCEPPALWRRSGTCSGSSPQSDQGIDEDNQYCHCCHHWHHRQRCHHPHDVNLNSVLQVFQIPLNASQRVPQLCRCPLLLFSSSGHGDDYNYKWWCQWCWCWWQQQPHLSSPAPHLS